MIAYMNKKRYVLVVGIILIGVFSLVLLNSKLDNKETVLDEVKLKENKASKKSFAIMIQKEDKTGYEVYEEVSWPTNAIYNNELSGCIDNYGSIIENSMTYNQETNKVTINTRVTSSCYLYFDLDKESPIVSATVNNNNSTNASMTISSNESGTYCVNTSSTASNMSNCIFNGNITKDSSITTSVFTTGGDYYAHVKDNAGNIGISGKVTVTLASPLGQYIIDNSISGLDKTIITGDTLYRFSGTSGNTGINNYICLGTTSKCTSGSDNMYRIIGVEPSTGYVKVIKQTYLNATTYQWHSKSGVTWLNSSLYSTLQTYYNSLSWKSKIVSHTWGLGDVTSYSNKSEVLTAELTNPQTAYVGALALSDYYLAYTTDQNWGSSYNTNNWIGLYNNGNTSDAEWTMTRYDIQPWLVGGNGKAYTLTVTIGFAVRPTFFLDYDVNRISGSGTSGDPFIVI